MTYAMNNEHGPVVPREPADLGQRAGRIDRPGSPWTLVEIRDELDLIEDSYLKADATERVRLTLRRMQLLEAMEDLTAGRDVSGVTNGERPSVP